MSTAALVSVEEYLTTSYRPDCEYVDGQVLERNLGQIDHSKLQLRILVWFWERRHALGISVFPEQRVQVAPRRFRVPDACVFESPEPVEKIFTRPPYICVEILSPEDTWSRLQERFDDYLTMGVGNIWVLDPETRRAWWIATEGHREALDGVLHTRDGKIGLPVGDLF